MNKETLNEKILNLRAAVIGGILRKKKIKHSINVLEKIIVNRDNFSAYNYFAARKNIKKKVIILSISTLIIIIIFYIIYKYWPLTLLKEMFYK